LTDSKNGPKSGKFLEVLGSYDARIKNDIKQLKIDRIKELMTTGAKLSDTLHNFLVNEKVIAGKKVNKLPKKTATKKEVVAEEAPVAPAAPSEEAPVNNSTVTA
jgi:small subunit ribosomal protein S16